MVEKVLHRMIDYFGDDVRRINHALKVYGFACTISRLEKLSMEFIDIVEIAAVLHDIGIPISEKKYNSCIGKYQEIEGQPIALEILEKLNIKPEIIERVCYIIGNHHTYTKIDGIDFQILVEADFLVNIYEDEMTETAVSSVKEKYFKTITGISLINSLYINHNI
jgi:HD superfamily phosphodiesterase